MKFVRDAIEKKLSELLGRQVSFEQFKVSPLSGQIEAEGMMVAGEAGDKPLLSVARIGAKVAVAKALAGQIVIKSMEIEGASINLPLGKDGSIQLPAFPKRAGADPDAKSDNNWQLEAQSIRLSDGMVFLGGAAVAEKFTGELKMPAGSLAVAELKGSVNMARCRAALSTAVALPFPLSAMVFDGSAEVQVMLEIDYPTKILIRDVNLRAGGIQVPLILT